MYIKVSTEKGITATKGLQYTDALRLLGTAISAIMENTAEQIKAKESEETYKLVHDGMYDMFNYMAANILDRFDPERKPGTDLTSQAILEAENAILDREVEEVSQEVKDYVAKKGEELNAGDNNSDSDT